MKIRNAIHRLPSLAVLLFAILTVSCVKENMSNCEVAVSRQVKVVIDDDSNLDPINPSDVNGIKLYVFDGNGTFLETRTASLNQVVELKYPLSVDLRVVAIANENSLNETITQFATKAANNISEAKITLKDLADYTASKIVGSPSDLMQGSTDKNNTIPQGTVVEIPISRIVGSIKLTAHNLERLTAETRPDLRFKIDTKYDAVDFERNASAKASNLAHKPTTGSYNENDDYIIPAFNTFSSKAGESVTVYIYNAQDELLEEVLVDKDDVALVSKNGKLLNILLDYDRSGKLIVSIEITPWGEEYVWKEFQD